MTKKIIALYDSNEDFICRLCSGFQQNCTLSLEFLPFTSLEKLLTFHSDHSISMLLTTEAMLTPQLISLFSETLILLSEGSSQTLQVLSGGAGCLIFKAGGGL